jgi:hypothetical protein
MKQQIAETQARLTARPPKEPPGASAPDADDPERRKRQASGVRVKFVKSKTITANHERLFEWLVANQERIATHVRACLAKKAAEVEESLTNWVDEDAGILLPRSTEPSRRDDLIRIESVVLDSVAPIVGLHFATTWSEADVEHGGEFVVYYHDGTICCSGDATGPDWDESFLESASDELLGRFDV